MLINDASITGSLIVNASSSFQNIAVSGNILPGTNNVYNLGSVDKHFKEIFVSTGSINFVNNGSIATTITSVAGGGIQIGSVQITTSSISFVDSTGSVTQTIAQSSSVGSTSNFTTTASFNSYTSSNDTTNTTQTGRLSNLETKSASVDISITNINSFTSSNSNTSLNSYTSSQDTKNTTLGSYTGSIDTKWTSISNVTIAKTGSYATTGSNSFYGTQVFSGSVYIANDLVVQGSSSIQYISASSVSIGTNIIQLNTANPSVRFAGLTMIDSGSVGGSGSFLYDSLQDEFIFVHRGNGSNVTSSHFVTGPETYDNLGNELYLTCNIILKGTGKEHLVDSCIFDNGTTICIKNNLIGTGTACFIGAATFSGNILNSYSSCTTTANAFPRIGASNTNATQQDYNISELYVSAGNGAVNGGLVASYSSTYPTSTPSVMLRNNGDGPLYFSTNGSIKQTIANNGTITIACNLSVGTSADAGGGFGTMIAYQPYGAASFSCNLNVLPDGTYIVTASMVRGGDGINQTYSAMFIYHHYISSGGTDIINTIVSSTAPGNNNGALSLSGTTISIGWGGARGPASISALRLRTS